MSKFDQSKISILKILKPLVKTIFKVTMWLLAFLGVYMLAAFLIPMISVGPLVDNENEDVSIFILTNGVHTDIVVPCKSEYYDWTASIKPENTKSKDTMAQYLAIGWGDKGFYLETPTWADLKASTALKAAFGLNSTALHTTFYTSMSESKNCKEVRISNENYQKLIAYINNSFKTTSSGSPELVQTEVRYGNNDAFYEAKGSYSLFTTCNTWANNALKSCNQKACLWTPFDKGIFDLYE